MPMGPGMGMMPGMPMRDPEMAKLCWADMELEQESQALARAYRQASTEQREDLKKRIAETVNKQFDVRQQRHELELKRLEEQLKKLREIVERRTKARKTLVEKRIADLVGPEEPGVEF